MEDQVRLGRNFVRKGDPIKVKLRGKTQFRNGFKFLGWDPVGEVATVIAPNGNHRCVTLDGIQRIAVTKGGERIR